jgi:membrane glycosyltransferase
MTLLAAPAMLPAEAPLDMPVQRLFGNAPARREVETRPPGLLVKRCC